MDTFPGTQIEISSRTMRWTFYILDLFDAKYTPDVVNKYLSWYA